MPMSVARVRACVGSRLRLFVAMLLLIGSAGVIGYERRPLPAFTVVSPTGGAASSGALSGESRWVLIYVSADCRSCDRLLAALKEWSSPQLTSRTVVIVRGGVAEAAAYMERQGGAGGPPLTWYADERGQVAVALGIKGGPVLLGIERGEIDWTLGGVLNDPKAVESVIRRWVEY